MTFEELNPIRGWLIAIIIIVIPSLVILNTIIKDKFKSKLNILNFTLNFIGAGASFSIFLMFTFISGWDQYFESLKQGESIEHGGRHQIAAKVITTLGEMQVSSIGIVFGIIGLLFTIYGIVLLKKQYSFRIFPKVMISTNLFFPT